MRFCPYCNETISYGKLMSYGSGKGFTKYEPCPHCGETYKVTLNVFFLITILLLCVGLLIFFLEPEGRLENRLYSLFLVLAIWPIFPFFTKLSKTE